MAVRRIAVEEAFVTPEIMGGGVPFWLQRIDNRYLLEVKSGAVDKLSKLPSHYFLDNFVITTGGVTSMPAVRLCLDVLGVERILFAADDPYEDNAAAVNFMDGAQVTEVERKQIYEPTPGASSS